MDFPRSFLYAGPQYTTRAQDVPAPLFRRKFIAPAGAQAELVITGLGFYEVWLNGAHLTKGFLAPYISAADDLIYYDRYDLTEHLLEGENVLAIELGNGFFNDPAGYVWDFDRAPWIGAPRTAFRLTLKKDGEETRIESDEQVLTHPSPILMDDYRWGEIYDARKELPGWTLPGWTLPGFDDRLWAHAMPCEAPSGEARLCEAEPLAVREILKPVSIEKQDEGYLYDFGVDTTGICRVRICGHAGQKIALYHGEKLKGGKFDMDNIKFEHRYGPDDRVQRDVLILKEGENDYTPTFTYHGFRYVLVKGLEETQATEELLTMLVISSALPEVGGFDCSDEMANTLQKLTRNSDLSNFIYFPTDCPQREKNGGEIDKVGKVARRTAGRRTLRSPASTSCSTSARKRATASGCATSARRRAMRARCPASCPPAAGALTGATGRPGTTCCLISPTTSSACAGTRRPFGSARRT